MPLLSSKSYRIGRSKTGLGLFATQPIKKGSKIIRYFGPMLDCKKEKDDAVENKYLFQITKRWTVDGSVRKNIARYINHACKPNAESDVNTRKLKITIRAIKDIEPGQEINYDYGTEYYKEYLKPIGCKCDSCEKKRKKKLADARAEKAALKAKAETKALRQAEKAKLAKNGKAVKARVSAKTKSSAKVKSSAKKTAPKTAAKKRPAGKKAPGARTRAAA
ncbi:MAG: SET domain-containing protein-lysine N-methyltransferase [Tardiphaga sp.]